MKGSIELDTSEPLRCGAQIADRIVMPLMRQVEQSMDHGARVELWTAMFAATLGMMTAAVGPDHAEAIYLSLRRAFDEARQIDAAQAEGRVQ